MSVSDYYQSLTRASFPGMSVLTDNPISFSTVPKEHWYQPDWINEVVATGRKTLQMQYMIYVTISWPYSSFLQTAFRTFCGFPQLAFSFLTSVVMIAIGICAASIQGWVYIRRFQYIFVYHYYDSSFSSMNSSKIINTTSV